MQPCFDPKHFPLVGSSFQSNRWEMTLAKVTAQTIRRMKGGQKIAALTAYDFPTTKLLDEAGIDFIHVGDTLGMVVLGYPDTTLVTMEEMEHHVRAAARAKPRALLAADLPYRSYETVESAVANARRLIAAGAEAVKAEGGRQMLAQVRAIVEAGIPYCGHLGMLPSSQRGRRLSHQRQSQSERNVAGRRASVVRRRRCLS
jgi:3-methyl-2-oxobutanoate hydroxymethyltransferase